MRAIVFRAVVAGLLLGMLAACAPKPGTQASSGRSATLFDSQAEAFFALECTGRPIDAPKVDHDLLAAALFHETNMRRMKNGLPPLRHDSRLDAAAKMHAGDMARHNYLSHTNPHRPQRRTPQDRALLAGFRFRFLAENVATQFTIQYQSGRTVYRVPAGTGFSYRPDGPPIPR
ncbi:MAG: CAP domain-containing protein, partial [Desulfatitalea sp.]